MILIKPQETVVQDQKYEAEKEGSADQRIILDARTVRVTCMVKTWEFRWSAPDDWLQCRQIKVKHNILTLKNSDRSRFHQFIPLQIQKWIRGSPK